MNPIAAVHWTDDNGKERSSLMYKQSDMETLTAYLTVKQTVYFVCMCGELSSTPIPSKASRSLVDRVS